MERPQDASPSCLPHDALQDQQGQAVQRGNSGHPALLAPSSPSASISPSRLPLCAWLGVRRIQLLLRSTLRRGLNNQALDCVTHKDLSKPGFFALFWWQQGKGLATPPRCPGSPVSHHIITASTGSTEPLLAWTDCQDRPQGLSAMDAAASSSPAALTAPAARS